MTTKVLIQTDTVTPVLVPIDLIDPNPYQQPGVRDQLKVSEIMDSLERNCENGSKGLLQVPIARRVGNRYQLAFGHHRYYAFKALYDMGKGFFEEMPLIVRELSDQAMFEALAEENFKRRDLSDIERARTIRDYMVTFGKNSVETGAFFQMSPESVRDMVRLLKLPKDLQKGVEDGTINRANARRLLTIYRAAPDQVRNVAKELKEHPNAEPDTVISSALRNSGNTVEMSSGWRHDTEPLAGPNLWPLRMPAEKFPRQHLPSISVDQAFKVTGLKWETHQDRLVMKNRLEYLQSGGAVNQMPGYSTIEDVLPEHLQQFDRLAHLVNPPACSACPFYAKVNGSHFCTFRDCYTRKSAAWRANVLAEAVRQLGIAPYDHKIDGKFVELIPYRPEHAKLVKNASPDLRLKKGYGYSSFEGVPDGYIIVVVGKTAEKLLENSKESTRSSVKTNDESYHAEQRRLAAMREAHREAAYDFLWTVGTPAFAGLLGELSNLAFVKEFADRMVRGVPEEEPNGKASKKERLDFYRRALLFSLLDDVLDMWDICQKKKPVAAMAKELQRLATTWGVKLPRNWLDQAAQADAAITVTTETAEA